MRIGIDLGCWANHRGYGRYTRELVRAMVARAPRDTFQCFLDPQSATTFDLDAPNVEPVAVSQSAAPSAAASADGYRSPLDLLRFTAAVWRHAPDVFFSPSVYTYFPLPPRQRAVVAVHDAIADRFPELTLPSRRARLFWKAKVALALRQARLVITVSEFARGELVRALGVSSDRIRVTGEAPAAAYQPSSPAAILEAARRHGIPDGTPWFAYVGGFNPHKHVDLLAEAHARVVAEHGGHPPMLALVGATTEAFHGNLAAVRSAITRGKTEALVRWTGYLPDDELRHLLSGAVALVLPSECEGFGLPAVEAAACGTPVIATTESPLPQLLAGGGYFVAPRDLTALSGAMRRLLEDADGRRAMGQQALVAARALTWERAAEAALAALHEAAA